MVERQTDEKAIIEVNLMKALEIIVAVIVTLIASWAGLMIGDSLLAGTRGLSIIFAICSMGAFVIAYCGKDK